MAKKETQPISLKFLIFIIAMFTIILFYATSPNDVKKIKETKTYEEMLEYNNSASRQQKTKKVSNQKKEQLPQTYKKQTNSYTTKSTTNTYNSYQRNNIANSYNTVQRTNINTNVKSYNNTNVKSYNNTNKTINKSNQAEYNKLLDSLRNIPIQSTNSIDVIVNKILAYKGYPQGIIRVTEETIGQSAVKTQGSYLIAQFEFPTGEMKISREQIYKLDMKLIISIIAHELDHFEKIAQVCKSMGVEQFGNFLAENGVKTYNKAFWMRASQYADLTNFDSKLYTDAVRRYLNQNKIELTSSYSDFYRLSENMRNPLELSAYGVSDYIQTYYGIPLSEGPMKTITKKFNEVDWAIYNLTSKNEIIKNERIPLFDYFYSKAIVKTFPNYKTLLDNCISQNDGDLSMFWINFEKVLSNFYIQGRIDAKSLEIILTLLNETKTEAQKGISDIEIANALKYKVKTILSNIVYPNAIKNIRKTSIAYLRYIKSKNISQPKTELDFILTLLCIDNELYKNNNNQIALYYMKIPEELTTLYNIKNNNQKYHFIYNNSEFKRLLNASGTTDQNLLTQLLDSHRLNIRIKDY